jgi:hypothetical protein
LIFEINSDFVEDDYSNILNCVNTNTNKCSSAKLKTKDLECCKATVKYYESYDTDEDIESCSPTFTKYISKEMISQIESIAIEDYGIIKAYLDYDIPHMKVLIECSRKSASYEFGNYKYTSNDLTKLKSKNHCLYYYYNSIEENLFSSTNISISKEKCINAESLDITKNSDIYCAYSDVAILYSDGTKNEFKTCYFLPSESINSKKLDPTTEAALERATQYQARKSNKIVEEYNATMVDKNGRSITYNSVTGTVISNSDSIDYSMMYSMNKFLVLIMLIILF